MDRALQVQPVVEPGLSVAVSWKAGQRHTEFSTLAPVATACAKLADRMASSGAQTGVSSSLPWSPRLGVLKDTPWPWAAGREVASCTARA